MGYWNDEDGDRCGILLVLVVVAVMGGIGVGWVASLFVFQGYSLIYWTQAPVGWMLLVVGILLLFLGVFVIFYCCNLLYRKWQSSR